LPKTKPIAVSTPTPSRVVVTRPASEWFARIKDELIRNDIEHYRAGVVARGVVSALTPQPARLEAMDHESLSPETRE